MESTKRKVLSRILSCYTITGVCFIVLAIILFLTPALPYLWYRINQNATTDEAQSLQFPVIQDPQESDILKDPLDLELPPFDGTLTNINTLSIPSIGVQGEIHENPDAVNGLELGIWRAYEWGTPESQFTTILAAHRFGYISWTSDFRTTQSFYSLPNTKVDDTIEIIWNQRRYEYRIYKAEDGTGVTDYNADLILYTCRIFNSPVRVFRYAERTN